MTPRSVLEMELQYLTEQGQGPAARRIREAIEDQALAYALVVADLEDKLADALGADPPPHPWAALDIGD